MGQKLAVKLGTAPNVEPQAKKKTSLLTWVVAGFFGLLIFNVTTSKLSPISSTSNPATPAETSSVYSPPTWDYQNFNDAVSGKESIQASITSTNSFELDFPYRGGTNASLIIRKHPRYGKNIIFNISKGQLLCTSYDGCQVSVKFDDREPFKVHANEPADHSSTTLFLSNYAKLIKQIRNSKTMVIEATFYQNGSKAFEFNTSNLNFD